MPLLSSRDFVRGWAVAAGNMISNRCVCGPFRLTAEGGNSYFFRLFGPFHWGCNWRICPYGGLLLCLKILFLYF